MISVDKFLPFVIPYADQVPSVVARQAISKAAHLFCTQTLVWQEDLPVMLLHPGKFCEIPVPKFAQVVKIMEVYYNGLRLQSTSRDELDSHNRMDVKELEGDPRSYYQVSLNTIRLVPAPQEHGQIRVTVALAPTIDAKKVPDDIFKRFWEPIVHGALADIKQIQGQSYSDPQAAITYKALFAQSVREAKNEAYRSFGRDVGKVAFQRIV